MLSLTISMPSCPYRVIPPSCRWPWDLLVPRDSVRYQFTGLFRLATHEAHIIWYTYCSVEPLQWRHNEHDGVSNHQPHDCLLSRLFRRRSKKTSKLRVTGICVGNSPGTGEFPAQRASNAETVSIWWRYHVYFTIIYHQLVLDSFNLFTHILHGCFIVSVQVQ